MLIFDNILQIVYICTCWVLTINLVLLYEVVEMKLCEKIRLEAREAAKFKLLNSDIIEDQYLGNFRYGDTLKGGAEKKVSIYMKEARSIMHQLEKFKALNNSKDADCINYILCSLSDGLSALFMYNFEAEKQMKRLIKIATDFLDYA